MRTARAPVIAEESKHTVVARCSRIPQGRASNGTLQTFEKPDNDAVYTFDVKIDLDRGLTFFQTGSFAIVLCNTMPSEAWVRVVKLHNSETQILFYT